jgi:hypothetical protein
MAVASLKVSIERIDAVLSQHGQAPTPVLSLATEIQRDIGELPGVSDEAKFRIAEFQMNFLAALATGGNGISDIKLTHACWAFAVVACRYAAPLRQKVGLARKR